MSLMSAVEVGPFKRKGCSEILEIPRYRGGGRKNCDGLDVLRQIQAGGNAATADQRGLEL